MRKNILKLMAFTLLFFASHIGFGQKERGFFHIDKIVKSLPIYRYHEAHLNELNKKYSDSLDLLINTLIDNSFTEHTIKHSPAELKVIESSIHKIQLEIESCQEKYLALLEKKRQEFDMILDIIVWSSINDFAKSIRLISLFQNLICSIVKDVMIIQTS